MNYELLSEADSHFMVKHPDGSTFKVAKRGLNKKAIDKIRALTPTVKMSDGGFVDGNDTGLNNPDDIAAEEQFIQDNTNTDPPPIDPATRIGQGPLSDAEKTEVARNQALMTAQAQQDSQGPAPASTDASASNPLPMANNTPPTPSSASQQTQIPAQTAQPQPQKAIGLGDLVPGFNETAAGINQNAKANQEYGNQVALAYDKLANDEQAIAAQHQKNYDTILKNMDQARQQASAKIDPGRYWSNMSTGQKVVSAISVFLGGLGARDGRPNYALQVLNDGINKDIEAQKANAQNGNNLYTQYLRQYGDERQAEQATRLQLIATTQAQIAKLAAQNGSQQALGNAKIAIGTLQQQAIPIVANMAKTQTMNQLVGANASGGGGIPTNQVPASVLSDPKTSGRLVDISGKSYLARTEDEAKTLRTQNEKIESVLSQIDSLSKLGKSAMIPGTTANNMAHAIRARLSTELPQLNGIGRINEREIHLAQEVISDPTSFKQALAGGVRNQQAIKTLIDEVELDRANKLIGYKPLRTVQ